MDRFKKILVPIDGKKGSLECLKLASHIAVQNNSEIHMVHVVNLSVIRKVTALSDNDEQALIEKSEKQAEVYFKTFIKQIENELTKKIKFITKIFRAKNVGEALIEYAQKNDMNLIVIGLTSKKHASDVVVGHVTLRVVEFSHIPVLTLPVHKEFLLED